MAMTPDLESPTKHLNGSSHSQDSNRNGEVCNGYSEKKHKDKHKEKHKDKDRHKHKSHKHDKDRDRNREKEKEKSHKSSNSNSSPEKDRSKYDKVHVDKSPEKSKYEGSSNSSKDRDNSSKDSKHHKSKHKEKHRDKDREKDRNKERDRDKDREKKSSSSSDKLKEQVDIKLEPQVVKAEPATPVKSEFPSSMASVESDDDDDIPLGQRKLVSSFNKQVTQKIKDEEESDDDVPLSARKKSVDAVSKKRKPQSDSDDDDKPLIQRKKVKTESTKSKVKKRARSESEDSDGDYNKKKSKNKSRASSKSSAASNPTPKKGRKAKEEEEEVWRWWEEAPRDDGVKWNFLEHKGPVFAPGYEPLPKGIQLRYNGKPIKLAQDAEEVAGFYSRFIEHDYTTKEKFNTNFFKDWRKMMTKQEREVITDLSKCDFADINNYYKMKSEERKAMSKEGKLKLKEENEEIQKLHGTCVLDGHKEKIGNFRIEPPGLFRGRGDHPKMGMLKRRVIPEDVTINCSKNSKIPPPPAGHKWKEVKHDNTVTWLACWTENVQGQSKYVMLNPTSRLKGEKDWMKYEKARELAKKIDKIRENYRNDFKSKEMRVRQRAVAMYFIDKLALRAGNEKDEDQADTVGCCSLRFEHIQLHDEKDGQENVVTFDFLGKDSIRYFNEVPVEKRVFKNLKIFMDNKKPGDDLFDRLNTLILNKHLSELMDGLTAKVFRTYNASHTLQQQLDELTPKNGTPAEKILAYNRANRAVAILCNHQRAAPKSHEKSMENLVNKIDIKKDEIKKLKKEIKNLNKGSKDHEKKTNALKRLQQQVEKLEMSRTDKEEGKEIALGTSKLNYLDPRITVAWCKKYDVPVEKVYNKTQRAKFRWAIDMADKHYRFD